MRLAQQRATTDTRVSEFSRNNGHQRIRIFLQDAEHFSD
jgi:hypothetical protein